MEHIYWQEHHGNAPGHTDDRRCEHGIRWPHECDACLALVPRKGNLPRMESRNGCCPICGGSDCKSPHD